ncbi:MAG: RNA methyltransferase [bacterium]
MTIEGLRELTKALDNGVSIAQLFVDETLTDSEEVAEIVRRAADCGGRVFHVSSRISAKIAYREHPDGLLAVAKQPTWSLHDFKLQSCPLVVVAVGLEKPGNVGSILRSVDAAGADGVVVCDGCTDLANPNVVRASLGTVFSVQVAQADSDETLRWLKKKEIQLVAASPDASLEYTEIDLRKPTAVVVGPEDSGLSEQWKATAHIAAKIPMKGQADSLNVAMATTILLYEAVRQRG